MDVSVPKREIHRELKVSDAVEGAMGPVVVLAIYACYAVLFTHMGIDLILGPAGIPVLINSILCVMGLHAYFKYRHKKRPEKVSQRRLNILLFSAIILGSNWGALNIILMAQGSVEDQMIVLILATMAVFATVGINSIYVSLGFSLPIMLVSWSSVLWFDVFGWVTATLLFGLGTGSFVQFVLAGRKNKIASITLMLENTQALNDRLEAEEQLRKAEAEAAFAEQKRQSEAVEMQRNLINAIAFPMVLSHANEALEVTPAGRQQFKVADGPLVNVAISDFFVHAEDQQTMIQMLETAGKIDNFEVLMHDSEGKQFWTVASMRPLKYDGKDCWLNSIYVIDARKRMEQDLAAAKDSAEAMLAELKTAQDSLVHAEKMASLGQLTAGIAHEIKNPLNFVNNFSKLSAELLDELTEILKDPIAALDTEDREDAEDLLETVQGNLLKIDEHGKRADSIVKNMLLHSRQGPGEKQKINLNSLSEEAMNLAYHGARAADSSFNVDMKKDLAVDIQLVECHPQDLQRVFLNLCSNGMYEAVKHGKKVDQSPLLSISSRMEKNTVIVEVTDNGGGVPDGIKDKIFQPFFTTKPTGEGTGLGLSMSYDIIQQHGGNLTVESKSGQGTTFRVELPAVSEMETTI